MERVEGGGRGDRWWRRKEKERLRGKERKKGDGEMREEGGRCIKIKWNTIYQGEKEVNASRSGGGGGNSYPFFALSFPSQSFSQTALSPSFFPFICSPSLSFFPSPQSLLFPWRPCKEFQLEDPPHLKLISVEKREERQEKEWEYACHKV